MIEDHEAVKLKSQKVIKTNKKTITVFHQSRLFLFLMIKQMFN